MHPPSFGSKGKSTNVSLNVFALRVLKSDREESVIKSRDLRGFCTSVITVIYYFPMNPEELVLLQTSKIFKYGLRDFSLTSNKVEL